MTNLGKTIDGLERLRFFNQRAGRELWADKPHDVQEQDIASADKVLADAIEWMKSKPEVVRCKDCRFRYTQCCIVKDQPLMDTFYCWQGTPKEGDEK